MVSHGHVWELGDVIDTSQFPAYETWETGPRIADSMETRRRLMYVARMLISLGYADLGKEILSLLEWKVWDHKDPNIWLSQVTLPTRSVHVHHGDRDSGCFYRWQVASSRTTDCPVPITTQLSLSGTGKTTTTTTWQT